MLLLKEFHSIVLLLYYRLWWPYLSKRNGKNNRIAERIALLDLASGIISIITPLTILNNNTIVTIMCRNDELSWLFTNRFRATRYMKVKRMGITEILRRIWLFSANKTKSSESFSKQPTQLIVELNSSLRHIIVTLDSKFFTDMRK